MGTTNNTWRIILTVAIIAAFFMPWYNFFLIKASAWDIVMSNNGSEDQGATIFRYSILIIPVLALIILIRSVNKQSTHGILRIILFIFTALLAIIFFYGMKDKMETQDVFKILGIGLYISVLASFALMFVGGPAIKGIINQTNTTTTATL